MKIARCALRVASSTIPLLVAASLSAQGVTTAAVSGYVTANQKPLEGAQIQVINRSTGANTGAVSRA